MLKFLCKNSAEKPCLGVLVTRDAERSPRE